MEVKAQETKVGIAGVQDGIMDQAKKMEAQTQETKVGIVGFQDGMGDQAKTSKVGIEIEMETWAEESNVVIEGIQKKIEIEMEAWAQEPKAVIEGVQKEIGVEMEVQAFETKLGIEVEMEAQAQGTKVEMVKVQVNGPKVGMQCAQEAFSDEVNFEGLVTGMQLRVDIQVQELFYEDSIGFDTRSHNRPQWIRTAHQGYNIGHQGIGLHELASHIEQSQWLGVMV